MAEKTKHPEDTFTMIFYKILIYCKNVIAIPAVSGLSSMCTRVNQDSDQSRDTIKHLDVIVIDNLSSLKSILNFNKFIFFSY